MPSPARSRASPDCAEAHYNLSFALSNLGDFDAALRETKRALELDPYYVPQKFELAIDFQYEHPDLSIVPDLGGPARADEHHPWSPISRSMASLLDSLFTELSPGAGVEAVPGRWPIRTAWPATTCRRGCTTGPPPRSAAR